MRAILALILVGLIATTLSSPGNALPPNSGSYLGPGTIVLGVNGGDDATGAGQLILADNGAVTCTNTDFTGGAASGLGGVCIPFGQLGGDSVYVQDDTHGTNLAFQVCVDNNGDGICTGNSESFLNLNGCANDMIVFSHESSSGVFHNPLWIPPYFETTWNSCNPGFTLAFAGYIVILCAGVDSSPVVHQHEVDQGRVFGVTTGGGGHGTFCGGPTAAKNYLV